MEGASTRKVRVEQRRLEDIRPYERNPRKNENAVEAVAESIRRFGWQQPIVVDEEGVILAGHTRYKAAELLGLDEVPVLVARGLTEEQARAYRLADNRLAELALWDFDKLEEELGKLEDFDFEEMGIDFSFLDYGKDVQDHLSEFLTDDEDEDALYPVKIQIDRKWQKTVHDFKVTESRRVERELVARLRGAL